jgi:hypothetical protein
MTPDLYESEELTSLIIQGMEDTKAKNIIILDLQDIEHAITNYFVICHGSSKPQLEANPGIKRALKTRNGFCWITSMWWSISSGMTGENSTNSRNYGLMPTSPTINTKNNNQDNYISTDQIRQNGRGEFQQTG